MNKNLFKISILLNVILLILMFYSGYRLREYIYQKWILHTGKATVVMFGDSHTYHGKWNFLIKNETVLKMGYSGFNSDQLRALLPLTFYYQPEIVFIQCGGNDVGHHDFSVQKTLSNFKFMADTLRCQNIQPVFQKLLYQHTNPGYNKTIDSLNYHLESFCQEINIDLIDIGKEMYDSAGLKSTLTYDNIHLNKKGYKLWGNAINKYLNTK